MKKFFKSKVAATLLVLCVLLGMAVPAFAVNGTLNIYWDLDMTDQKNYTLCLGTKREYPNYVLFANTKGQAINLWAARESTGVVLTETVTLTQGQKSVRCRYKSGMQPADNTRMKARGELSSAKGTYVAQGACNFE